jgi:hypothetical protein
MSLNNSNVENDDGDYHVSIISSEISKQESQITETISTNSPYIDSSEFKINFDTIFDIKNSIDFSNTNDQEYNNFDYDDYEQFINAKSNNININIFYDENENINHVENDVEYDDDEEEYNDNDDEYDDNDDDDDYNDNDSNIIYEKVKDKINIKSNNESFIPSSSDEKDHICRSTTPSIFKYKDDSIINKCKQWTLEDVNQVMSSKTNPIGKYLRDAGIDSTEAISLMDKLEIAPTKER